MRSDSLDEWEERLRPQVADVDLLGEVVLSEEEVRSLGQQIGDLVRREGWGRASQRLRNQYPCAYAVFLVATGAYHYEQGAFWHAVRDVTGLPISPVQTLWWGQLFEEIVRNLPVAQFSFSYGRRYIGPILAHSGIPNYCLADFFEHFLQPLLTRPEFASLSTEEFIQQRLLQASISYVADKPVLRFLEHGGPLAVDFLERCQEMALQFAERGEIPSPEAVGLPPRVVQEYQAWLEGRARPSLRKRSTLRSPVLSLDPWGLGVVLRLPSQPVSAIGCPNPDPKMYWLVYPGDIPLIPVQPHREKVEWEPVPLTAPAPEYRVSLICIYAEEDGCQIEIVREWEIPGVAEKCPILWFDPKDGRQISPREDTLPGGRLWVLRRPDVVLEADPQGSLQVSEQFPRPPWEWSDFIGEEIDLTRAQTLRARWGNRSLKYFVLSELQDQPSLEGSNRLPIEDNRPPLYVGRPPSLRIPLPANVPLHCWHVEIWNEGPALPEIYSSGTLKDLRPEVREREAVLDLQAWLKGTLMGTYNVKVRGPLGRKADLAFRILPMLEMVGYEVLYLPEQAREARLLVETDVHTELALQPGATGVQAVLQEENDRRRLYEVTADIARADFPLRFARRTPQGDWVYVPLSVPIRRLRWMILTGQPSLDRQWHTAPIRLPLEALEQAREPLLLVDVFGGADEGLKVTLSLRDEDDTPLQEQEGRWRAGQPYLRFDLAAFLDTLRHLGALLATFVLNLTGLPGRGEVSYPVLQVSRRFVAQLTGVESVQIGDTLYLRLRWEAPVQVRHRLARLWPLWRPWEPPLEIPIPDSEQDEHRHPFPKDQLVPGKYLLEITARNPWATDAERLTRPDADDLMSVLIPANAVAVRLQELRQQAADSGPSFPVALETACIRRDVGQEALAQEAFQWCFEHLDEADVVHILALTCAVAENPDLYQPLQIKMAAARRLRRVLNDFRQGLLPETLYQEYLDQLPHSSRWSAETCEILLDVDDESRRFQAIQRLIELEQPSGILSLVRWLQEGRISDEDALTLAKQNLPWVTQELEKALPDPAAIRMLENMAQQYPDQVPVIRVRPGHWVRCVAGWGQLERIETSGGARLEEFLSRCPQPGLRLHVLLRAHDPKRSEKVVISLDEKTLAFSGAKQVYTCSKCGQFSSQYQTLITEEHNRVAHGGLGPSFRIVEPLLSQPTPLKFRASPPHQPWE